MKIIRKKGKNYVSVEVLAEMLEKTKKQLGELEVDNEIMEIHKGARMESMTELIELLESLK